MSPTSSGLERIHVRIDPDLADLIPGYLDNRRQDITLIQQALEQQDFETIRMTGHKMKGSGGGYGFDEITDIGRILEMAAREAKGDLVRQTVRDLSEYLERIEIVFHEPL